MTDAVTGQALGNPTSFQTYDVAKRWARRSEDARSDVKDAALYMCQATMSPYDPPPGPPPPPPSN